MATEEQVKTEFRTFKKKYKTDPVRFVRDVLGVKQITDDQIEVMSAVARGERRISVASGHGVGKTALCAWLCLWFLLTRYPCKIVVTAPSGATLEDGLMAEIKVWLKIMPADLQKLLEQKTTSIELRAAPDGAFISARTARAESPDALQGVHSANVLLIADEASGVPDKVFEAAAGSMSGGEGAMVKGEATTILIGNPVRASGYFYESHHKGAELWWRRTISCVGNPLVSPKYIEEMAILYGVNSNEYRMRVLGLFPEGDDDKIIPIFLAEAAIGREGVAMAPSAPIIWGLDVAGEGQSALAKRQGRRLLEPIWRRRGLADRMQLVAQVQAEYLSTPKERQPVAIMVDSIGMGGPVYDRLKELELPVVAIAVSDLPAMQNVYGNLRAELWWEAKQWLTGMDVFFPVIDRKTDPFIEELTCLRIDHDAKNKLLAESKKKLKARGVSSPDGADAFVMTFAHNAAVARYGTGMPGSSTKRVLKRNIRGIV